MQMWKKIYKQIIQTQEYKKNILYGKPRPGHDEGTVQAHIAELDKNLDWLNKKLRTLSDDTYWKLKILIHVHDTFKAVATPNAPICDLNSHATLAKEFLAKYTDDADMLNIVQYHDVNYAVYKKFKSTGRMDSHRILAVCELISDLDLFLLFCILDAGTASKGREMITWFVEYVNEWRQISPNSSKWYVSTSCIIPGEPVTDKGEW